MIKFMNNKQSDYKALILRHINHIKSIGIYKW